MLFNLHSDISEKNNLAQNEKEILYTMLDLLKGWESELTKPLWGPGNDCELGVSGK